MKRQGGLSYLPQSNSLQFLGDPYLDQRLPRNSQPFCLDIQAADHPGREIHVDPSLLLAGPGGMLQVEIANNAVTGVKFLIEILFVLP